MSSWQNHRTKWEIFQQEVWLPESTSLRYLPLSTFPGEIGVRNFAKYGVPPCTTGLTQYNKQITTKMTPAAEGIEPSSSYCWWSLSGWWYTYPSEKWWSSSVGIMTFPTEWKHKIHVPNHQPVFWGDSCGTWRFSKSWGEPKIMPARSDVCHRNGPWKMWFHHLVEVLSLMSIYIYIYIYNYM